MCHFGKQNGINSKKSSLYVYSGFVYLHFEKTDKETFRSQEESHDLIFFFLLSFPFWPVLRGDSRKGVVLFVACC